MPAELRKLSDIWAAIDQQRIDANMKSREWKQSFEAVKAALLHVGLILVTTREDFDALPVPNRSRGCKDYMARKVIVSKDGIVCPPTNIDSCLTGTSGLLTDSERAAINAAKSITMSLARPTGIAHSNAVETNAIDVLDELIGTHTVLYKEHLLENRLADVAYCPLDADVKAAVFAGDQTKTSRATENGRVTFNAHHGVMSVAHMLSILTSQMSLTCAGFAHEGDLEVVWLFYGQEAIQDLQMFDLKQQFHPRLHMKTPAVKPFTLLINQPKYRFDVGKIPDDRDRLLQRRVGIVERAQKHTLRFLNEDDSQIPGNNHRKEQQAFALTREACDLLGVVVYRTVTDGYTPVDFRVKGHDFESRNQDKLASKKSCGLRPEGRHPYNPDSFDILQITQLDTKIIYAIPMRRHLDEQIVSHFTSDQLMKATICLGSQWQTDNAGFRHDLSTTEGSQSYVAICKAASKIGQLSDADFYNRMLKKYDHMFGSQQERERKKTLAEGI